MIKAGWVIGGSGGSGTLFFHGRAYPLAVGGIDYGILFGASKTELQGRVSNIRRPSDVAGLYGAAGAGLAIGAGARAIVLTNQKGSGGSGTLVFHGRAYPLAVGGVDYGIVFGASQTDLHGRVSNIRRPSDVAGVYGAAGAGLTIGRGARGIVLTNQNGAVLQLTGRQVGLMVNADLSGLAITMR